MEVAPIHHIEAPDGTYEQTAHGLSRLTASHLNSPVVSRMLSLFYREAQKVIEAPFTIEAYRYDREKNAWDVKLLFYDGNTHILEVAQQDIHDELTLSSKRAVQKSFTESTGLLVPSYEDGYTRAATHYFTNTPIKEDNILNEWSWSKPRVRFVVQDGTIHLMKGFSTIERIFRKIFYRQEMRQWEEQNRQAVRAYVGFLEREIGKEKLEQIQKTYGFDFEKMIKDGDPLLPKYIYFCNIGMNNIEMSDVTLLGNKIEDFLSEHRVDERLLTIFMSGNHPFTNREARAILQRFGQEGTVADLYRYIGAVRDESGMSSEHLDHERFGKLVKLLETPKGQWERLYTGRKFSKTIKGSYNKEISDRKTFRPWIDQQELLQVFNEMKDPFPGQVVNREKLDRYFFEMITKVVVKKHLMRSETDGTWRVGALIPSPYKDSSGHTVYYRVDQGVDSGHGKLWYVLRPACDDYDPSLPVIRAPRDTSRDHYAQRGGHTITRDLAKHAGYLYSSSTYEEDKKFFNEFTLPVWMGHLAVTMRTYHQVKESEDYEALAEPLNAMHQALQHEIKKRVFEKQMPKEEGERLACQLEQIHRAIQRAEGIDQLRLTQTYIATILAINPSRTPELAPYDVDDFVRFTNLMEGRVPRPLASIGNSLGGFDAQNDLIRHTLTSNRIPIVNVQLFTHSSLKVDREEEQHFSDFIIQNKDLLKALRVKMSIQHVTEFNDKVSLFTHGTFLGRGLQGYAKEAAMRGEEFPVDVQLDVFNPLATSRNPQITELKTHMRRIEHLVEGEDYELLPEYQSIDAYDDYARNYRFKGRKLEAWRETGIALGLADFTKKIIYLWRKIKGMTHRIPKSYAFHKLVVEYDPKTRTNSHSFVPPSPSRGFDRIRYVKAAEFRL
ncbi:MAG: hypothetical protein H7A41_00595 [Chlamydiales bacterium]|nr:hypothetical protein [Chlamydiales bacterium]